MNAVSAQCLETIDTLVLAGGLGTRIRPVLGDTPKLLAPIAGRAYLDRLLDWLEGFGAHRVVLGLGHRAAAVEAHLAGRKAPAPKVEAVIEPQPLGTAGALRFARQHLHTDPVLVLNGDSFAAADLCRFLDRHRRAGMAGTILCAAVEDAGRYGRVKVDDSGNIGGFVEKDPGYRGKALVNAGIYLLSAQLLDLIAAGTATSLEKDVFERLPAGSLAAFTECDNFIDIGTPESLAQAGAFFTAGRL